VLKFLPSSVKKIFSAHPDHDEEKDTINPIKGKKSNGRQEEARNDRQEEACIGRQGEINSHAKDEG
jgi:hypothetical protein